MIEAMLKYFRRSPEEPVQAEWHFGIYYIEYRGSHRYCCSLLPETLVYKKGLPEVAIVGFFEGNDLAPSRFEPNELFESDFHEFIAGYGIYSVSIQQQAYDQQEGFVYLLDQREAAAGGEVLPENIIGAFEVNGGKAGGYIRNLDHRLFTAAGFFDPGPELRTRFLNHLMNTCSR